MKIALLWNFNQAKKIFPNWRDGHRAALEEIGKKHILNWYLAEETENVPDDYGFLLFWTDPANSLVDKFQQHKARRGLMLTTDLGLPGNLFKYNVVFCESEPIVRQVRGLGIRAIKGMGTDTDFYKPDLKVKKDIEYFYPATFSPWKRQSNIAHLGKKLLCVGIIQPDGKKEFEACKKAGVKIKVGYFPAETIRNYYNRAKKVIIPSIHGSERTVLEAMSMGILPDVTNSANQRARSYLKEFKESGCKNPRTFVLKNYSHKIYAKALLSGIEK